MAPKGGTELHPQIAAWLRRRSANAGTGLRVAAVLALAGVATVAASCSSGAGPSAAAPSVASLPGHHVQTPSTAPPTVAQSDSDFVAFTRCMRAHGVQMSDPFHRSGHQGLSIDLPAHGSTTNGAYAACNHFLAKIEQAKNADGAATLSAGSLRALTNYAGCMRQHDIDMLDPTRLGELNLGDVPGITSDFGRYSPQFRAADRACRHLLPPGTEDDGTGP